MNSDIFKAIADPTRRAILILLASQSMTPNALAEEFNTTRQAVSKHIKVLTTSQLVKQNKQGREIYYELIPDNLDQVNNWLDQIKEQWQHKFHNLDTVISQLKKGKK